MAERVIRFERKQGFTILQNNMLRDPRLSLKTKGLFAVMLSKPGSWEFSVAGLAVNNGVGRDAIRTSLKELEQAGYLAREKQAHGERGKFAGSVYLLHEESLVPWSENPTTVHTSDAPLSDYPSTAEPSSAEPPPGHPTQVKKDLVKNDLSNPPKAPPGGQPPPEKPKRSRATKSVPDWKPERFAKFWSFYPRHEDRVSAAAEWDRLKPDDGLLTVMASALSRQKASDQWREGIGIPYACRWLKKRRWEDEPPVAEPGVPQPTGKVVGDEEVPTW